MMIRMPCLESRKIWKNSNHAKKVKRHMWFLMYFTDGTLSSCTEISLTGQRYWVVFSE